MFYSNMAYKSIDQKRVLYYKRIEQICKNHNINLYIFTTPLHPLLLDLINENSNTKLALKEMVQFLSTFKNFYNLYYDTAISNDLRNFHGATHTSSNAGDILLKKLFLELKSNLLHK